MTQEAIIIPAEAREKTGKGSSRALRREGRVPAIVYGGKEEDLAVSIDANEFRKLYIKGHITSKVVTVEVNGKKITALPRDVQVHPVTDFPEHVDFLRLAKGEKVRVLVGIRLRNAEKSPGLKRGGVLNIVRRDIELVCSPDAIPTHIDIDLDGKKIGESIHISHIKLPEGAQPTITDRDFTILAIAGRGAAKKEAEEDAAGEEGAE